MSKTKRTITIDDSVYYQLADEANERSTAMERFQWTDVAREVLARWAKRRAAREAAKSDTTPD